MMILVNLLALALVVGDEPKLPTRVEAQEVWHLSLPDAIRIGIENSEVVRVISKGNQPIQAGLLDPTPLNPSVKNPRENRSEMVIARVVVDASVWNFKAALMAHVRSIEQQYWALSMAQITLWSRETACKIGEEIFRRERAMLAEGRSTLADVAETEQQLNTYRLNLVSATSDVVTTERQLRNILGLAATDNRRIVPDTPPSESEVKPDWETCVATMLASQPDIAQQVQLAGSTRLKAMIEAENPTLPAERREASQAQRVRQQKFLQETVHQATHSLARFFLEIEATYKQYKIAQKLRESAQIRLEAQRAAYEDRKITVDRLLDALTQYTNAISQEAQYKSMYNTSIASLEEAQGTILSCYGIAIAPQFGTPKTDPISRDKNLAPAAFTLPTEAPAPIAPVVVAPTPAPARAEATGTTYKLKATFGVLRGLQVELEVVPGSK